ncbi:MAG: hypothetical protein IR164_02730 [Devosia sp.]|jgi:hypothetical protein|uniref:hypothetical protein n=1 Tax=unclassified Devosia TaxID=196773 RepID=UPI0019EBC3C3|nr:MULTISPECIES: hypothetical protein [unclassified Devosia]MBF0677841.1 hypothetical protein [Devosia sp.]WEJ33208.1 hypothetical protein NYQ88_20545 [Devosia sp. SD17-2]
MFTLRHIWRRALAWLNAPGNGATPLSPRTADTDAMTLHDWSDLPAHHPGRTQAPC